MPTTKLVVYKTDSKFTPREAFGFLDTFELKELLLSQVIKAEMSNLRAGNAHTKTRGEVRGGGKKPWKQKGTGRARHGSRRSPIWVGGGITFGPRNIRNFHQKINKTSRLSALKTIFKDRILEGRVFELNTSKIDKTVDAVKLLEKISKQITTKTKQTAVLYAPGQKESMRGFANTDCRLIPVQNLKIINLVNSLAYIATPEAIQFLETKLNK